MTFEADLITRIKTACPRAFFGFAPVSTQRPYCTVQQIGGPSINPLANTAPGLRLAEMQIDVWAGSYVEAMTTIRAIEAAMRGATAFTAKPMGEPISDYDADIPVFRAGQDFSCWHRT